MTNAQEIIADDNSYNFVVEAVPLDENNTVNKDGVEEVRSKLTRMCNILIDLHSCAICFNYKNIQTLAQVLSFITKNCRWLPKDTKIIQGGCPATFENRKSS